MFKTEKNIEIQLVRQTEVCGKVLIEKSGYKSVKTALLFLMLLMQTTKQVFVYKRRPFFITFMGFDRCSNSISEVILYQ